MSTMAIDTHQTFKKLQEKGFSPEQAEGIVQTITESDLVTKTDLTATINKQTTDLKMWVVLMLLGQATIIVGLQNLLVG